MAYGFGTTFGTSGTTDRIDLGLVTNPEIFSAFMWTYRVGGGGGGFGRTFDSSRIFFFNHQVATTYRYGRGFTATSGAWTVPQPTLSAWHPVVVRHDGSSASNVPLIDLETPQTVTTVIAPAGTAVTSSNGNRFIGNNNTTLDRGWDGLLAEYAVWNRILTDSEVAGLVAGYSPLFYLNGLIEHRPLIRPAVDIKGASATATVTGALVQPHPPIRYPSSRSVFSIPAAAAGFQAAWAARSNVLLMPGRAA
jgi:hypothetical protein